MRIDAFHYNGEEEVLRLRLAILDEFVDLFVICEATETFSGEKKSLSLPWDIQKNPKVRYFSVPNEWDDERTQLARTSKNVGNGEHYWVREFLQKEYMKDALAKCGLDDKDLVFVSDVDEIWNPDILSQIDGEKLCKPRQNLTYLYWVNNRTPEDWTAFTGTIATNWENIKGDCLNHLRTHWRNDYKFIENGGWHFNALGGKSKKLDSFAGHPVYTPEYMDGRGRGTWISDEGLPKELLINREKYNHLFL